MKTKEITLYTYDELSDSAKEHARYDFISSEPFNDDELRSSLDAFESVFPIKIGKWEYGGCTPWIDFTFTADETIEELSGWRLATYIWNNYKDDIYKGKYYSKMRWEGDKYILKIRHSKIILESQMCPFTGVCFDEDLLDPIWKFLKAPDDTTFIDLMKNCLDSWISAADKEWNYENSEEYFAEMCEANEWTFRENGEMEN